MSTSSVNLSQYPVLVLNADHQPLNYYPLSTWSAEEAIKQVWEENVDVLANYEAEVRSPSHTWKIPSVIALKRYVPMSNHVPFTRFNVFLRDRFTCQYCGERFKSSELTFEHVLPRSHGGKTCWTNISAACSSCNLRKADRTPRQAGMPLLFGEPFEPTKWQLRDAQKDFPPKHLHETWNDFLYWNSELEQ